MFNVLQLNTSIKQLTIKAKAVTVVAKCMDYSDCSTGVADCLLDEVEPWITFLLSKCFRLWLHSQHTLKWCILIGHAVITECMYVHLILSYHKLNGQTRVVKIQQCGIQPNKLQCRADHSNNYCQILSSLEIWLMTDWYAAKFTRLGLKPWPTTQARSTSITGSPHL